MHVKQFTAAVDELFGEWLTQFPEGDEYAFYHYGPDHFRTIGYATNMSPEVVQQAAEQQVDLIITHHDAWDFVFGMQERCHELLKEFGISHFFVHLPLDYADFGTNSSLFQALGIDTIIEPSTHHEGRTLPGIGEFASPVTFEALVEKVSNTLEEPVKAWKHSDRTIKKVGIITGAGNLSTNIRDADEAGCDVYITGEKTLYTVQYAQFIGMNLIVGSHTFTEIFGIRSFAEKLQQSFRDMKIVHLAEAHFE